MSSKEGPILPTFHQNPIPFIKDFRKHLPLICISILSKLLYQKWFYFKIIDKYIYFH